MIFTTDLDRTLIYSERVLSKYPSNVDYTVVEAVDDRSISFTSTAFFNWIRNREKGRDLKVVANTARSIREFIRVDIHKEFDYAIVANGGIILKDGIPIEDWEENIDRNNINKLMTHIIEDLSNMKCINYNSRVIDNSYLLTKTSNNEECTQELNQLVQKYKDISFMVQRNKVYIIPNEISKVNAIKWLSEYLGEEIVLAAGDSETDLDMLKTSKVSIVPGHADIIKKNMITPDLRVGVGLLASVDILKILKDLENGRDIRWV